jgi:hypothetical protein
MVQNVESFHNQPIRDVEYCPNRTNNILLTASIDKSAKMIDYRSNSVVQTYRVSYYFAYRNTEAGSKDSNNESSALEYFI